MPLKQLFKSIEKTILAKYEQSFSIYHHGDIRNAIFILI